MVLLYELYIPTALQIPLQKVLFGELKTYLLSCCDSYNRKEAFKCNCKTLTAQYFIHTLKHYNQLC